MTNRILFAFVCVIAFHTSVANLSQGQGVFDTAQAQVKTEDAEKAEKAKKENEQYASINWPPSFRNGVICYFNTTYDRKEGDINQSPENYSPDMDSNKLAQAVEVVQASWFRRSACMRDIRRTNALLSSVGAVGYLAS